MEIQIDKVNYTVIDAKEKITIADSFVVPQNKIGSGNGEAKLYIGNDNNDLRSFFGNNGFKISCFLLKKDLIKYLDETKTEYQNPEQPYVRKDELPNLWQYRRNEVLGLDEVVKFEVSEQTQIEGPRVYVNSNDIAYKLIRKLSLPNITYISIIKLTDGNGHLSYYFRLFC